MAGGRPVHSAPVCGSAATCVSTKVEEVGTPAGQANGIVPHPVDEATRTPGIDSSEVSCESIPSVEPASAGGEDPGDGDHCGRGTADSGRATTPTPYRARRSCACHGIDVAR